MTKRKYNAEHPLRQPRPNRLTKHSVIIDRFEKSHGERYDYSQVVYTGSSKPVSIICKEHGVFKQTAYNHSKGHGCPKCAGVGRKTQVEAIADFIKVHGKRYDYSLVDYKSVDTKVKIICKVHGVFEQSPYDHAKGCNCHACAIIEHPSLQYKDNAEAIAKFVSIHGETYDYSKVNYQGAYTPVVITCREHGDFLQVPHNHNAGSGCSECAKLKKNTYSRDGYIASCKISNQGNSSLYVVRMVGNNEIFYKIGITKETLEERFRKVKDYRVEMIYFIGGEAGYIYDLENRLHRLLNKFSYKPLIEFGGHTECFAKITRPVEKLLKQLENTEQLQLLA